MRLRYSNGQFHHLCITLIGNKWTINIETFFPYPLQLLTGIPNWYPVNMKLTKQCWSTKQQLCYYFHQCRNRMLPNPLLTDLFWILNAHHDREIYFLLLQQPPRLRRIWGVWIGQDLNKDCPQKLYAPQSWARVGQNWLQLCLFYQTPLETVVIILQANIDSGVINSTRNITSGQYFNFPFIGLVR